MATVRTWGASSISAAARRCCAAERGTALVPGDPLASPLYQSVRRALDDPKTMPPKEYDRIEPAQAAAFKGWIEAGAPWEEEAGKN